MLRLEPLFQGTVQRSLTNLPAQHCPMHSRTGVRGFPRVAATVPRNKPGALQPLPAVPQPQPSGRGGARPAARPCPPCPMLRQRRGWDAGTAGCSASPATLQPNTKSARRLWLPGSESVLSPFFWSTRRHPTKEGAPAFKRFLFQGRGPPWKSRIHQAASVWGCFSLPANRPNTEREPDINLLLKGKT